MSVIVQGQFGVKKKRHLILGECYSFRITVWNTPDNKVFEIKSRGDIKELDGRIAVVELLDNEIVSYIDTCKASAICLDERGKTIARFKNLHRYEDFPNAQIRDDTVLVDDVDKPHSTESNTEQNHSLPISTNNSDSKSTESEYNQIGLIVDVAPVKGSGMQEYFVSEVSCQQLPFLGEEILRQLKDQKLSYGNKNKFKVLAEKKAIAYLNSFGFSVGAKAELREGTKESRSLDLDIPKDALVNLYVDLGSTNGKWIVENVTKEGESLGFRRACRNGTCVMTGRWGVEYDKTFAYSLENDKFKEWLSFAALEFMRYIQSEERVNVVNIVWSFPQLIGRDGVKHLKFMDCSEYVNRELQKCGLLGRFELVPEGESLKWMFMDVVRMLAKESEQEIMENEQRERQEEINKKHNASERKKVDLQRAEWERKHNALYKFFIKFHPETNWHNTERKEALGRLELMKAFRNTGARGDGKFDILILDAGGSTLDFYLMSGGRSVSGSYRAGGNQVTSIIKEVKQLDSFEIAEEYKCTLSMPGMNTKEYYDITSRVYNNCLEDVAKNLPASTNSLCVVITGLAMMNPNLQVLIREHFRIDNNQILMYSPAMADLFTDEMCSRYPKLADFKLIVFSTDCRFKVDPRPAHDVCGGLYFYAKNNAGRG